MINRRFPGVEIILNPVKVQGEEAAEEIANAIDEFNEYGEIDVMIVGRGGGSLEDLWAFNEEVVARAIFRSEIPVQKSGVLVEYFIYGKQISGKEVVYPDQAPMKLNQYIVNITKNPFIKNAQTD